MTAIAPPKTTWKRRFCLASFLFILLFPGQPYTTPAAQEVLPADQVFQVEGRAAGPHHLEVLFRIADGTYLYRHKLKFEIQPPEIQPVDFQLPAGQPKEDPVFGRIEIYRQSLQLHIPISRPPLETRDITLTVQYQGCSDGGFCYPPQRKKINLTLPPSPPATALKTPPGSEPIEASDSHKYDRLFREGNVLFVLLSFFGFGLLLSLTPCVFPMIPILSGIIVAQGTSVPKGRRFTLSLIYVLGMALTFAVVGVIAGLTGFLISTLLQNPWVIGFFSLIMVLLALSMFGFYEIQLPSVLQGLLTRSSNRFSGGSFSGVFFMGILSALIIGPCVTPPLAGALLFIGQTQNFWLGGTALFILALGMGVPLLVIGASAGLILFKAGIWMEAIKTFFGVLLLGLALYQVSPFISLSLQMFLWAALLIISSIYLRALESLPEGARGWAQFRKGVGMLIFLIGLALLIGALGGGKNLYQPLEGLLEGGGSGTPLKGTTTTSGLKFLRLTSPAELEQQLRSARGQKVLLYFGAEWCTACKAMERGAFRDLRVQERLKEVKILKFDLTDMTEEAQALLKKFGLFGSPAILFFDEQGQEIKTARLIGEQEPASLLENLNKVMG
jgi:thiol:disulfide interchange protein DsbD